MRRSNCSAPIPRAPRGHHFFRGRLCLLITLFLLCPALYIHSNHSFLQRPALTYHTHFSSDPGAAPGGMGAEQFDRRIIKAKVLPFLVKIILISLSEGGRLLGTKE